ncbi:unnamed protein product [Sphenostylis stenocarpa]|uniref:Uncharacterized protein n=1 Tax=Sphenostylis stenocarpa TaxID=92480 RepID=A0AA86RZQ6_9FABA|nr:unnamed protein product [Sphenostylis stenocarpa]
MDEGEKSKKKRVNEKKRERSQNQKLKLDQEGPTKDEVDHFFTVLRRIKLALHNFHSQPNAANHWREALEGTHVALHHQRLRCPVTGDHFDLNAAPSESADA